MGLGLGQSLLMLFPLLFPHLQSPNTLALQYSSQPLSVQENRDRPVLSSEAARSYRTAVRKSGSRRHESAEGTPRAACQTNMLAPDGAVGHWRVMSSSWTDTRGNCALRCRAAGLQATVGIGVIRIQHQHGPPLRDIQPQ